MEKLNNFEKGKINKNNYFYYHDQETPMKQRVLMLKKLFIQFSDLKEDQCIKLINSYDNNID